MIITLAGPNGYEVEAQRRTVENNFVKKYGLESVTRLSGETTTIEELRNSLQATNLFTPKTMVILSKPSSNKNLYGALEEVVGAVPDSTTLIITDTSLDKRTRVYKLLQSKTDFREYGLLDEVTAGRWVVKRAQERGGKIDTVTAKFLVERLGPDQWQLAQELEKLIAYQKTITKESIEALVIPNLETRVFDLLDAVFRHNEDHSRRMIAELKSIADPYELFGLLVWQVHALALVVSAQQEKGQGTLALRTQLKPFVVQKLQALEVDPTAAHRLARLVAELDVRLKSGAEPWSSVEQTLLRIASRN